MFRNSVTTGIVLHTNRIGEYHRGVTLLTENMGILNAIAHGAQKTRSRLRSATESFCLSTVYLYLDPVKNVYKITDMAVHHFFEALRRSLTLYYTASLWTEAIIKSYGAGENSSTLFNLYVDCLKALERLGQQKHLYISIQFLWRFLRLCGFNPDVNNCDDCGRHLSPGEDASLNIKSTDFLCNDCCNDPRFVLNPGARRFLERTTREPLAQALRYTLDEASLIKLKDTLYRLLQGLLETKLNSIECAQGII
jgi:DNA repair protein RecO (recombination protein O)